MQKDFLAKLSGDAGGLIGVRPKVKVANKEYLGLVYTPGVGAVCKAIEKDPKLADTLTNRANSCLIMTDSSGFENFNADSWVQEQAIPYIESRALLYKTFLNIDAYPILADSKLTTDGDSLFELVDNVSLSYGAINLCHVDKTREAKVRSSFEASPSETFIFTTEDSEFIAQQLKLSNIHEIVGHRLVEAAVIRVALDHKMRGFVDKDNLKAAIEDFTSKAKVGTEDLILILELISSLTKAIVKDTSSNIRDSQLFVKNYILHGMESRPVDTHQYHAADRDESAIHIHERFRGMVETYPKAKVGSLATFEKYFDSSNLSAVQATLKDDPELADYITLRRNYSSIATNGTAILGFGDIGALAGMPVMEGKCVLFKELGTVNMMVLCLKEKNPDKFISIMRRLAPIFTSINMEDIKAPDCFKIENELRDTCRPAVFHDDQHGTAVVTCAAVLNYCKLTKKQMKDLKVVINGAGAAGMTICKLLMDFEVSDIVICDSKGIIYKGRTEGMNEEKHWMAENTNKEAVQGKLADAVKGRDLFVGVSVPKCLTEEMVKTMNDNCMIMAMANPIPEIYPEEAKKGGAYVTCTGRSDFANQVNNSLAFPGIFYAIKRYRIPNITNNMTKESVKALADMVTDDKLTPNWVIPEALNNNIPKIISKRLGDAAKEENNIRPGPKTNIDLQDQETFEL